MNKIFFFIVLFFSCGKGSSLYNTSGICCSIAESQRRGVFIQKYQFIIENLDSMNLQIDIPIDSVWLENIWKYDYPFEKTKVGSGYQIVIKMKNETWRNHYNKDWFIGTDYEFNFTPNNKKNLVSNYFDELPLDHLMIKIQKEDKLADHQKKEIIGMLKLIKK